MEGYFWRFTDVARGRVLIALSGVCRADDGTWALNAAAAHPGQVTTWAIDPRGAVGARDGPLRVALPQVTLDVRVEPVVEWARGRPFGALGPAHAVPGLGQYWHPHLLLGRAHGTATVAGETWPLDGATVYAEKNWGSAFAGHWWWGQAHLDGAAVSFAGGRLLGGAPTSVVVALEGRVLRFAPPLQRLRVATAPGRWRIRAPGLELEAE
ncbi:MAG: hypothetical protein QOE86_3482, partial [Solirubrobacteraceae bacterium]|nr:hypothetical protein [Solirubrobacteraceae bacterium]